VSEGRRGAWCFEVACVALTLVAAWPILAGRLPDGGDARRIDVPLVAEVGRALSDGERLVWHPDLFNGYHALGAGQSLAVYPPILALLALGFGPEGTLALHGLLHLYLLCRGAAAAALALGGSRRGALLAAATTLLGGQSAQLLPHACHLVGVAWLPWLVALAARAAGPTPGPRPLLVLGAAWGLAGLGSSPPFLWYPALATLLTGAAAGGARGLLRAGLGGAIGVGLALPALVPIAAWTLANPRPDHGDHFAWWSAGGLSAADLLRLLLPGAFSATAEGVWETRAPLGVAALTLALARLLSGRLDPAARVGLALVVAGALLAAPLEPLQRITSALPVVTLFRSPARYLLISQLGVALLASSAVGAARRGGVGRVASGASAALVGLALLLAAAVSVRFSLLAGRADSILSRPDPYLAALGLTAAVVVLRGRRARGLPLLFGALLLELAWAWSGGVVFTPRVEVSEPPAILAPVLAAPPGARRVLDLLHEPAREAWTPARANAGSRWGAAYFLGYESLVPLATMGVEAGLRRTLVPGPPPPGSPGAFALRCAERSVTFVLVQAPVPPSLEHLPRVAVEGEVSLLAVPAPRPEAYAVAPAALRGDAVDTEGLAAAPVEVVAAGRTRRVVRAEGPAVVVVAQSWHPGWEATVDGAPAELLVADRLSLAVPIGPGRHEVVVTFDDPWVDVGLGLGLACWLGLAAARVRAGRGA